MLDLEKTLWFKSTLRIPKKGKFRAHLLRNGKEPEIQLFQYGHPSDSNQAHFKLSLAALLGTMEVVGRSPPRSDRRAAQMISTAALENELIENSDLSKNRKRKILKKLQKKMWKQYEQKQKRKHLLQRTNLKSWMQRSGIYEGTLFGELKSFSLETKDDIQELTKDDIDLVLRKVRGVRLSKLQGPEQGQMQQAMVDEDLAKVTRWLKAIRTV